jgi:beta-glucosidase/6-phospho-beta-glucosidase/beta-galactosidase
MMGNSLAFPPDFVWGAATASYQIEGAWTEGAKEKASGIALVTPRAKWPMVTRAT